MTARGVQVLIVQTSRTEAEHAANLEAGTSSTSRSLHLPRRLRLSTLEGAPQSSQDLDKADAIDLAPFDVYQLHGPDKLKWDTADPAWALSARKRKRSGCGGVVVGPIRMIQDTRNWSFPTGAR